jgi:FHS family L-fucose permease-like MFS transporter
VLGAVAERAGSIVSFYWGGAMIGRFIGAFALRIVKPGNALAACAVGACGLTALSSFSTGEFAAWTLIAVGLCNSIMFPTIFSLATEQLGEQTPHGSGLLCMAIVGGAVVPLITGAVADRTTLATALLVPAACYIGIVVYGVLAARRLGLDPNLRAESSAVA